MSKKSREAIKANLERAIAPSVSPRKRGSNLDGLLDEYAPPEDLSSTPNVGLKQSSSPTPSVSLTPDGASSTRGVRLTPRASLTPRVELKHDQHDLWANIPESRGYSRQFHAITDHLYRRLDPVEQAIYTQLFRLTHGFGKPSCVITLQKLAGRANVGTTAAHNAIKRLVAKGLAEKKTYIMGKGKEQGVELSLTLPAWLKQDLSPTPSVSLTPRVNIKEIDINKHTHKGGVGVFSRFALEDCRRYAESLRADGITNPGGYATKIHRSGEADEAIARFLEPAAEKSAKQSVADASRCPDCHGTGWWYPEGVKAGVRRCAHERLKPQE